MVDSYDLCEVAARVLARISNEQSVKIYPQPDGPQSLWKHCMFDKDYVVRLFLAVEVYCNRKPKGCDIVNLRTRWRFYCTIFTHIIMIGFQFTINTHYT